MALKKPTFEQEPTTQAQGDTATVEAPAETQATQTAEAPAVQEPAVATSVAIAKAASSSLSTNDAANAAKQFKRDIEAMRDAADFSWGSMRTFKAKDGSIREMNGEKLDFGKWVKVHMLAWTKHWEISPGEDGASSGAFVAYSRDGVTVDYVIGEENKSWEGKSVDDYVAYLKKDEDFDKAGKREFIDTQVAVLGSDEEPDFRGIVQVTLSSSSIPAFKKYQTDLEATAKCVQMGLPGYSLPESPFEFYFVREAASAGKNSWTKIKILTTLPAKV